MAKPSPTQKKILIAGGGFLVLLLLYRLYANNKQGTSSATGQSANPNTSASDYASLAGQEQGDVASLQNDQSQLYGLITGNAAAEQADIQNANEALLVSNANQNAVNQSLAGTLAGIATSITSLVNGAVPQAGAVFAPNAGIPTPGIFSVPSVAAGATKVSPSQIQKGTAGKLTAVPRSPTDHPAVAHPNPTHAAVKTTAKKTHVGGRTILTG